VGNKYFSPLTLSMVDNFFGVPVLLYGLEALDHKTTTSNSSDFAYNDVFVKLLNIKDIYITVISCCQRATKCLPASYRLDMRILCFYKALMSVQASPLAFETFSSSSKYVATAFLTLSTTNRTFHTMQSCIKVWF